MKRPLDCLAKLGFVQSAYSLPLGGNQLGLVYCDVGDHKALDDVSIAFDKASGLSLIVVRPRGYGSPVFKNFSKPLAVWNRQQELCHLCVVIQAPSRRDYFPKHNW